jgi:energy-coupling factor transporter ATP-binding protein EcfA2
MSASGTAAGSNGEVVRLPTEPYPGLRPFLNHEAMLLLGRERQVREVIDRLEQTQFVAVIGGSGSGKSSLVLAGVVPELRSFGMPGAGDFWLPMVCTPGTNVSQASATASQNTPITRLAWKFAKLLQSAESPEKEAARLADIASVFRQEAGFSRLVDTFADELLVRAGPAPKDLRLLFVIDQFEELFHPTNEGVEDVQLMVERVIDHFFNPHPRCFVLLTMRSEHLSNCAGYLELPDAINKSSYLVRRLDEEELREAIVGPAQRYLRLLQRLGQQGAHSLPDVVEFDVHMVDRLLRDVGAITHDPDHLPLLQHLLARLWEAACAREAVLAGVPAKIEWDDLRCAVLAGSQTGNVTYGGVNPESLDDKTNTLRDCLENWTEAIYLRHPEPQRTMLDSVLRRLAFKDPNTGMYTQERINVDDPTLFESAPNPRQTLRALIEDGFVGSVDYLFWDDENPQRVTLKVSHESFIRGWSRFRKWADEEDRQFQVYLRLLDDCDRWVAARASDEANSDDALSGGETLRVYEAASLEAALRDPERFGRFERLLQLDRDGQRVAPMSTKALDFLTLSFQKRDKRIAAREEEQRLQQVAKEDAARAKRDAAERERESEERARAADAEKERVKVIGKRNFWLAITTSIVAFIVLPYALFAIFIQTPVMRSVEKFANARVFIEGRDRSDLNPIAGAAGRELGVLLAAAELVEEAKANVAFLESRWMRPLVEWLPPVGEVKRLFAMSSSEPGVNGSLRGLLTTALWRSETDPIKVDKGSVFTPVRRETLCIITTPRGDPNSLLGSLFLDGDTGRGVFVPTLSTNDPEIALYAASFTNGKCTIGRIVWSVPRYLDPLILLDARVRYMAVAVTGPSVGQPSVSLYAISWEPGVDGQPPGAQVKFRSVVTDSAAVELVRQGVNPTKAKNVNVPEVESISSWLEMGGIGMSFRGNSWRLFADGAQRIESPDAESNWAKLELAEADSGCANLGRVLQKKVQDGFKSGTFQHGDLCFEIQRGNPKPRDQDATPNGGVIVVPARASEPQREQVLVAVYGQPQSDLLSQLASAPPNAIARLVVSSGLLPESDDWVIGKAGSYEGWIAQRRTEVNGGVVYSGAPWSTSALGRLGREVFALSKAAAAAAAVSSPAISRSRMPPDSSSLSR